MNRVIPHQKREYHMFTLRIRPSVKENVSHLVTTTDLEKFSILIPKKVKQTKNPQNFHLNGISVFHNL